MSNSLRNFCAALLAITGIVTLAACGGGGGDGMSQATTAPAGGGAGSGTGGSGGPGSGGGGTGGGDSGGGFSAPGTLRVALTDAPACGFDQVVVTVERVRVHQSMGANDNDSGWTDISVSPARKVDLLSLQNGVLVDLGQTTLPAGQYTQLRLMLSSNGTGTPANYVVPTKGSMTPMATPSAQQSGLKLIHGFTIEAGKTTGLVLDFDACKSIVRRGNGSFGLKPVIRVMPMTLTAIAGYVQTGLTDVTVSAQKNGVVMKATQPDSSGQFVLAPLDSAKGPYDVVFTGPGRTTAVVAGVQVEAEKTTTLNPSVSPVMMPVSLSGSISGKLLPPVAAATEGAEIRALQKVGTVPLVEVAFTTTFSATDDYSVPLPVAAPRLATWSNPMVYPIPFVAQDADATKYRLEASAPGYTTSALKDAIAPSASVDFLLVVAP
ncbi:MAG TPA: DUF4382 domain-containing protein [Burkholderiaceae bacterium]|nr:DUF4382 domain-containing protein [Burkholderiaceae bacterium]